MCEYCKKIINNKRILDIDNDKETYIEIDWQKAFGYMLYVEIEEQDKIIDLMAEQLTTPVHGKNGLNNILKIKQKRWNKTQNKF